MEQGFFHLALQVVKEPRVICVTVLMVLVIALANYVVGYRKKVKVVKKKKVVAAAPAPAPADEDGAEEGE